MRRALIVGLMTSPIALVCCLLSPCLLLSVPVCVGAWVLVVAALWRGGRWGSGAVAGLVAGSLVFAAVLGMQSCGVGGCGFDGLGGCALAACVATAWATASTRGIATVVALGLALCVSLNGCMLMGLESVGALAVGALAGGLLRARSKGA